MIVAAGSEAVLADIAKQTGVDFTALKADPKQGVHEAKRLRIGMYQRYRGGNMDEGWTRWLFEQWGFPFKDVMDAEIKKGNLNANYDVFILPDDTTRHDHRRGRRTAEDARRHSPASRTRRRPSTGAASAPTGVNALKDFVQKGGTLVTLGGATDFAITRLGLPVRNVVAGMSTKEFFCPGSTLRVKIDNTNPLAYGMPSEGSGAVPLQPGLRRRRHRRSTTGTRSSSAMPTATSSGAAG